MQTLGYLLCVQMSRVHIVASCSRKKSRVLIIFVGAMLDFFLAVVNTSAKLLHGEAPTVSPVSLGYLDKTRDVI